VRLPLARKKIAKSVNNVFPLVTWILECSVCGDENVEELELDNLTIFYKFYNKN